VTLRPCSHDKLLLNKTTHLNERDFVTNLLLIGRWAGEASAFSAHIVPVIVQRVLEHVD